MTGRSVAIAGIVSIAGASVLAGTSERFGAIYGDRIRAVQATQSSADDIELARQMLVEFRRLDDKELQQQVLVAAFELCIADESALPSAADALAILQALWPEKEREWRHRDVVLSAIYKDKQPSVENALQLARAQLGLGQLFLNEGLLAEAQDQIRLAAAALGGFEADAADEKQAIVWWSTYLADRGRAVLRLSSPDTLSPDERLQVMLVEMQELPKSDAAWLKDLSGDANRVLECMKRAQAELGADDALFLADWCVKCASEASSTARASILVEAYAMYSQYLAVRVSVDEERLRAESSRARVRRDLDATLPTPNQLELPPLGVQRPGRQPTNGPFATAGRSAEMECIRLVDPVIDSRKGQWSRTRDGALTVALEDMHREGPLIRIPVAISGSYSASLHFARTAGRDGFFLSLPAGKGHLVVSVGGPVSYVGKREIEKRVNLGDGRSHRIDAVIKLRPDDSVDVKVSVDGEMLVQDRWALAELEEGLPWTVPQQGIASLSVVDSAFRFDRLEVQSLQGSIRSLR